MADLIPDPELVAQVRRYPAATLSFSFSGPIDPETIRLLVGARPCDWCGRRVSMVDVVDDLDAAQPMKLGRRLSEYEDPGEFGVEHTPDRCLAAR